jgi:dCTP deaminase
MLLNASSILQLMDEGVIEGANGDQVNATSLDVTLGEDVLIECRGIQTIDLSKHEALNTHACKIHDYAGIELVPGQFLLACSRETFNLPNHISAEYKLKSSMARIGLEHLNAGWCDPGWHGSRLTLELKNMTSYHNIVLHKGDRIGQMVFFLHEPVPDAFSYANRGRYNGDRTVSGAKRPLQLSLEL